MPDVQIVRDVAGQRVVSKERDAAKKLVVVTGELALGDHHGPVAGHSENSAGNERIINALDQDVSLGAQTEHR
jgi:hypothetical protein